MTSDFVARERGYGWLRGPRAAIECRVRFAAHGSQVGSQADMARVPLVVAEEVLDNVPFVAQSKDKFLVPEAGVGLHDMPQDGSITQGQHGLGTELGLFTQPGSLPAAEDYNLHIGISRRNTTAVSEEGTAVSMTMIR